MSFSNSYLTIARGDKIVTWLTSNLTIANMTLSLAVLKFITERLDMLNAGRGFNDAFEEQIGLQAESKLGVMHFRYHVNCLLIYFVKITF